MNKQINENEENDLSGTSPDGSNLKVICLAIF
jgi:hypothetical protein